MEKKTSSKPERVTLNSLNGKIEMVMKLMIEMNLRLSKGINDLKVGQERMQVTIDKHTEILNDHTRTLNIHTAVLDKHSVILNNHTEILDDHTSSLCTLEGTTSQLKSDVAEIKLTLKIRKREQERAEMMLLADYQRFNKIEKRLDKVEKTLK